MKGVPRILIAVLLFFRSPQCKMWEDSLRTWTGKTVRSQIVKLTCQFLLHASWDRGPLKPQMARICNKNGLRSFCDLEDVTKSIRGASSFSEQEPQVTGLISPFVDSILKVLTTKSSQS